MGLDGEGDGAEVGVGFKSGPRKPLTSSRVCTVCQESGELIGNRHSRVNPGTGWNSPRLISEAFKFSGVEKLKQKIKLDGALLLKVDGEARENIRKSYYLGRFRS